MKHPLKKHLFGSPKAEDPRCVSRNEVVSGADEAWVRMSRGVFSEYFQQIPRPVLGQSKAVRDLQVYQRSAKNVSLFRGCFGGDDDDEIDIR